MTKSTTDLTEIGHDMKKSIRRLKLIFDELESSGEILSKEVILERKKDFEDDLNNIQSLWKNYCKLK